MHVVSLIIDNTCACIKPLHKFDTVDMMDKSGSSPAPITTIFGTEPHQLKLGRSFDGDKHRAFHTIRYDFKPASVDLSKEAVLEVGEGHEINISLPNIESKGTTCTKFKGSKRPLQKECVLIYDHRTGEFTLERLTCNMQVKKQRQEGTSKAQIGRVQANMDSATSLKNAMSVSSIHPKKKPDLPSSSAVLSAPDIDQGGEISPLQPSPLAPSPHTPPSHHVSFHHDDSDSSSSYITDSESDTKKSSGSYSSDEEQSRDCHMLRNGSLSNNGGRPRPSSRRPFRTRPFSAQILSPGNWRLPPVKSQSPCRTKQVDQSFDSAQYLRSQLSQDLQLSESDSDSD